MTQQHLPAPAPALWRAVLDRDAGRDGAFVYAVQTTGIYCRPTCASRRPRREKGREPKLGRQYRVGKPRRDTFDRGLYPERFGKAEALVLHAGLAVAQHPAAWWRGHVFAVPVVGSCFQPGLLTMEGHLTAPGPEGRVTAPGPVGIWQRYAARCKGAAGGKDRQC